LLNVGPNAQGKKRETGPKAHQILN